jgi:hypothetical protein
MCGNLENDYDTTLDLAIYDSNTRTLHYGHSGDGGILGLNDQGEYVAITQPQKNGDYVIPLRAGSATWVIETCQEHSLASVLLITDGIWEQIAPYKLALTKKKGDAVTDIYVPLCTFLMDPAWFTEKPERYWKMVFDLLSCALPEEEFYNTMYPCYAARVGEYAAAQLAEIRRSNMPLQMIGFVQDDKTATAIINSDCAIVPQNPLYYADPDWNLVEQAMRRELYPDLGKSLIGGWGYKKQESSFLAEQQKAVPTTESKSGTLAVETPTPLVEGNVAEADNHEQTSDGKAKCKKSHLSFLALSALLVLLTVAILWNVFWKTRRGG